MDLAKQHVGMTTWSSIHRAVRRLPRAITLAPAVMVVAATFWVYRAPVPPSVASVDSGNTAAISDSLLAAFRLSEKGSLGGRPGAGDSFYADFRLTEHIASGAGWHPAPNPDQIAALFRLGEHTALGPSITWSIGSFLSAERAER